MKDLCTSKTELLKEISSLKQRIRELEESEIALRQREKTLLESADKYRSAITEYRRTEELLQQKTALLEAQVNASPDGILIIDNGKKVLQNRRASDLLKIPKDPPDDVDAWIECVRNLVRDPEEYDRMRSYRIDHPDEVMRFDLEFKDGTVLERCSGPVIGEDGKRYGRIVTFRDITERKKSEEALRINRIHLAEAMDLAHIVSWEFDPSAKKYTFNDAFYSLYGTTAEKEGGYRMTMGEYAKRFVHPEDQPLFKKIVEQRSVMHDSEPTPDVEHRIIRRDGETRHILVRTSVVRNDSDFSVRVYGVNQDITKRKQTEELLHRSEETFRKAFYTTPDSINITRLSDGMFTSINRGFTEVMGYSEDDVKGRTSIELNIWDNTDDRTKLVKGLREEGKVENLEAEFRAKNGKIVYGMMSASVIDIDGVPHILSVTRDMTQRKQSEEEKARLESQLFQSQKMEAIGTLAGGVAHDFNNILTIISGFGSLLKMETEKGDPKEAYIDQILASSEKAVQLTRSLLAFSRYQQISLKPLHIDDAVRATSKILKRLLTEDIELRTRLSDRNTVIMADSSQLDQILFNLATNARDAMNHGGVLVVETEVVELDDEFIRTHGYGTPGEYVLLSVSDTGSGMDEITRNRIFEPFFTTKEEGKGTGLGLSTVYGIVKQHNGYINVYSEPGIGTTFRIYLPVMNEIAGNDEARQTFAEGGDETILIAEDNVGVREFISQILKTHGYSVIEAFDGVDAVEQFRKNVQAIDLLIFDSVMPRKNGRETHDEIEKIKSGIKVIFMSGYSKDIFADKGIHEKFNFLQKPILSDVLLRKVRQVLDDHSNSN
ncbi:MAG TPA: PAS domain S-box protein [Syntrophorhabdaceae bacterium]|nr:PAS domain S-box protein [Syntrophorhabdaceae bacterium]